MRTLLIATLLGMVNLTDPPPTDDFIPKDIIHAVAIGCSVGGYNEPPVPYAEAQVFVKWTPDAKKWDFNPVMSRRPLDQGGVLKAIDDCADWFRAVKATIEKQRASK